MSLLIRINVILFQIVFLVNPHPNENPGYGPGCPPLLPVCTLGAFLLFKPPADFFQFQYVCIIYNKKRVIQTIMAVKEINCNPGLHSFFTRSCYISA